MLVTTRKDGSSTVEIDGVAIECADEFVSRCVADIADRNIPDAILAAGVLNAAVQFSKTER